MMPITLNAVVFQKVLADLVIEELPIGGVLRTQRGKRRFFAEAFTPLGVKSSLSADGGETHVIEKRVEFDCSSSLWIDVPVIARSRRGGRGERQRIFQEPVT